MKFNIPWHLFYKLLNKSITQAEEQELAYWRDSSELHKNIYDEIIADEQFKSALLHKKWDDNSMEWNNIVSRIQQPSQRFSFSRQRFILMSAAAALLLLFSISALVYLSVNQRNFNNQQEGFTYIYSPRGQRTQVVLPDSTKVWLNSESSLSYSTNYNRKVREVIAQGEAFFEVTHNPEKPFYVLVNEIKIKVYGTSFNIKAFPNEKTIETTLIEGSLSITSQAENGKEQKEIFLKPNEKCIITRNAKNIGAKEINQALPMKAQDIQKLKHMKIEALVVQSNVNTQKEKLWKDGKLLFHDRSFGELAVDLERWYDVKIHFQDEKIKQYKFTGSFDKETINQAMEALKASSQESYQYNISFRDIYLQSN
jgi:transmembrane sensor